MIIAFLCNSNTVSVAVFDKSNRRAINQQAEEFRATIVAARIHFSLALIDQGEIKIGDHYAFTAAQGSPINSPCGETIVVKQPLEIGPTGHPVSCII